MSVESADMSIMFSTSRGWLPWLIRLLTRSAVSHCSLGASWRGVAVVIHADVGGVVMVSRVRWAQENTLIEEYEAPAGAHDRLGKAIEMISLPYDYVGLLGHLPVVFGRWIRLRLRNPLRSPNKLVCSELVLRVCEGCEEFAGLDPEGASPHDLLDVARRVSPRVVS